MNWHDLFNYDPVTGVLTWKISRSNKVKVGQVVGSITKTHKGKTCERHYLQVKVSYKCTYVHRIIWEMMNGESIPTGMQIDHRDGDGTNNKWENLRLASQSQNMGNQRKRVARLYNLPKGVIWHKRDRLYIARLGNKAKKYSKSIEEAKAAYDLAASEYYGEFARSK